MTPMTANVRNFVLKKNVCFENEKFTSEQQLTMETSTVTSYFSRSIILAFWTEKTQMAMADESVAGLVSEGIENPGDLYEYSKRELESIFEGFKKQPGKGSMTNMNRPRLYFSLPSQRSASSSRLRPPYSTPKSVDL